MNNLKITSFFDKAGQLNPQLITNDGPDNISTLIEFIRTEYRDRESRNSKLNINQLRKFYDSFLKIYNNGSS
jgi:hypothetical protein